MVIEKHDADCLPVSVWTVRYVWDNTGPASHMRELLYKIQAGVATSGWLRTNREKIPEDLVFRLAEAFLDNETRTPVTKEVRCLFHTHEDGKKCGV